jgi:hypothetical protein
VIPDQPASPPYGFRRRRVPPPPAQPAAPRRTEVGGRRARRRDRHLGPAAARRDALPQVPATDRTEHLRNAINWFWSDVSIVAKHHARRRPWAEGEITALWAVVDDVAQQLGTRIVRPEHRPAVLRPLLAQMERLATLPKAPACASGHADAYDWVSVSERPVQEGWSPASHQPHG